MIQQILHNEYFDLYDKVIRINDNESLCLKRLSDNTVVVTLEDELSGTLTNLACYIEGRWIGHNATNYNKLFNLFKVYKPLKSKLIKFLTPNRGTPEIKQFTKIITCARRKFIISIKTAHRSVSKRYNYDKMDYVSNADTNISNSKQGTTSTGVKVHTTNNKA
jgi:hypothetical protein